MDDIMAVGLANSTGLFAACASGDISAVREHVPSVFDSSRVNDVSVTPLWVACFTGKAKVVTLLLEAGADVDRGNVARECETPLLIACEMGHVDVVKILLENKAQVKGGLECGDWAPLLAACRGGHLEIVDLLLKAGADVNEKIERELNPAIDDYNDRPLTTPLLLASENGHAAVVERLLQQTDDNGERVVKIDEVDYRGRTPLMLACSNGHPSVVNLLLDSGADVNYTYYYDGEHNALTSASSCGHAAIVERLLKCNLEINWDEIEDEASLLEYAGIPKNLQSKRRTPGHEGVVKLLLNHKAAVDRYCVYCHVEPRTTMFIHGETGHSVSCEGCVPKFRAQPKEKQFCPLCYENVEKILTKFWI